MRKLGFIIVIIAGLIPLVNLLTPGLPITHDGTDHAARVANFYSGLSDGVLFPRWGEHLNWGFGHPVLMFLYPFSSYLASSFHFLGFSYVDSLKLVFAVGFVSSGIAMYLWAKEQFNQYYAVTAAIVYLYAPYRFVDLYVRGAIGEHVAFIFPPIIMLFMLLYFKNRKLVNIHLAGVSISFGLLLLSHNAISLMFFPVFAFYGIFLTFRNKEYKRLLALTLSFSYGFLISAFFTVPAFFEGKYTLRDIVTGNEYSSRFIKNPLTLLYGEWNYGITGQFTTQIGFASIIGLLTTIWTIFKVKSKEVRYLLCGFLLFGLLALFLTLSYSNFIYEVITTFKKFQFPWRFLSLSTFAFAVIAPSFLYLLKEEKHKKLFTVALCIIAILPTYSYWQAKDYKVIPDSFYDKVYYGTTDTGESAPIWSVRFMEKEAESRMQVIEGEAEIWEGKRTSVSHSYDVTAKTPVRLVENTLYFPGWKVISGSKEISTEFQDPNYRGLMTFMLPEGKHEISIVFEDTKLRTLSNLTSIFSFIGILIFLIYVKAIRK